MSKPCISLRGRYGSPAQPSPGAGRERRAGGGHPRSGDTQQGASKEKEIFRFPVCSGLREAGGPRTGPVLPWPLPALSHGPARPTGFGDTLGLSVGMSCPQQRPRDPQPPKNHALGGFGCPWEGPARPQLPEGWVIDWASGRSPKVIGIGESPFPGARFAPFDAFPAELGGSCGWNPWNPPAAALGTGPTWSFRDRRLQEGAGRCDSGWGHAWRPGHPTGSPGRMDGAEKSGNAGPGGGSAGGQEAGPGQEGSPGSGLGGKAEEERRKSSGPRRWRREEARPRAGAVPVHVVPAGRGRDTAVGPNLARSLPLQTPLVGLQVPAQPHLGARSLLGDPKSGERDPWDTPLVAAGVALPLRECPNKDSEPLGVQGGFGVSCGVSSVPLEFL